MRRVALCAILFLSLKSFSQHSPVKYSKEAEKWADSVYKKLNKEERIGQLMIARLSSMDVRTKVITSYYDRVADMIKKYNIGGLCIFQGSPVMQANQINSLQALSKTPMLLSIDAEWGVGMRILDSVLPFPRQMMLGAISDPSIIYEYGKAVAEQCRRLGLHVNYAPVVDVNNNPDNPVINDRSFGEDKFKVATYGIQYMKGLQDNGVMASAKHFPGHGDVAVDSHYDLPVIRKTIQQLDSLELFPFKQLFDAGVASTMVAHLYIPSIDASSNRATSLSRKNVTGLLRDSLGYNGLSITDGLEMQGVQKFFPDGEESVQALIAGNDLLLLPPDIPVAIKKIQDAIKKKRLSWDAIEKHCKKVLMAKYDFGITNVKTIETTNLSADLNKDVSRIRKIVAENAITLLSNEDAAFFPLAAGSANDIAYVAIGTDTANAFARRMREDYNAAVFYFPLNETITDPVQSTLNNIISGYKRVVIGVHNISRAPANNFGIGKGAASIINTLQQKTNSITFLFGNAYAAKNWCNARNLVICYEDDPIIHNTALDMLQGKLSYKGILPVTICENFKFGSGHLVKAYPAELLNASGYNPASMYKIDSITTDAIAKKATPGAVVLVAKNGKIIYHKAFGHYTYDRTDTVTTESVYDLASITKIAATTISLMKLYDEGKLDLKKKLGDYLPDLALSNKGSLIIEDILLHQAGLPAGIPFHREAMNRSGLFSDIPDDSFNIRVGSGMYLRSGQKDSMMKRIMQSSVSMQGKYIYSDLDFIYLGEIIKTITGLNVDDYAASTFYRPMNLESMGFHPANKLPLSKIVPTENDQTFRKQLLRGDVHDPTAAMFGGVAGHAGLFSNSRDLAAIMQLLLNGGTFNGKRYLEPQTVKLFTSYQSEQSRRGFGFDKPEKDNARRSQPYPAASASSYAFGHTGYTGTAAWADPEHGIVFIILANRVYPSGSDQYGSMNIRLKVLQAVYDSLKSI